MQQEAAEQKLAKLNAALNKCMQEIESLRVDQKMIADFDNEKKLECRLAEANKRVANLSAENTNLMNALLCKEKLVQDLDKIKAGLEIEIGMLTKRLDSVEKENTFLKYEYQEIEKEIEKSHRLESENLKQIEKLEAECQQLRNLVRKRLQCLNLPLTMKRLNPRIGDVENDCDLEEENKMLKEILALSDGELQSWKVKCDQMASEVAELKAQLNELSEAENSMQLAKSGLGLSNLDEVHNSESWDNALLMGLEQFRQTKINNEPEMEKFAVVNSGNELRPTSKRLVSTTADKRTLGCNNVQKNDRSSEISGLLTCESSHSNPTAPNHETENASFAREKIRKRLRFDISKCEDHMEIDSSNSHDTLAQLIEIQLSVQEENRRVKDKLASMIEENEVLRNQLAEATQSVISLQREQELLKESKGIIEEQVENQKLINEDLDTQLTVAKAKSNEILHKLSSLEVELEDKSNRCEELEATCLELQLQLQLEMCRLSAMESDADLLAKKLKTETFQKLTKQLMALPSPDVTQFDELLTPLSTAITVQKSSITDNKNPVHQRSTLRDHMMDEESRNGDSSEKRSVSLIEHRAPLPPPPGRKVQSIDQVSSLALVPSKKPSGGFGFITKLLYRRKKGGRKMKA